MVVSVLTGPFAASCRYCIIPIIVVKESVQLMSLGQCVFVLGLFQWRAVASAPEALPPARAEVAHRAGARGTT
jgi:hypothetical protein